jgi:hypothetical protein
MRLMALGKQIKGIEAFTLRHYRSVLLYTYLLFCILYSGLLGTVCASAQLVAYCS